MWLEQMKMIMNEYRLNLGTQEAQEFLLKQMEDYFFGEGRGAASRLRSTARRKNGLNRPPKTPAARSAISNRNWRCASRSACSAASGVSAAREDEAQIAGAFGQRHQLLALLRGDDRRPRCRRRNARRRVPGHRRKFLRAGSGSSLLRPRRARHRERRQDLHRRRGAGSALPIRAAPARTSPPMGRAATSSIQTPRRFTRISAWIGPA